MGVGIIVFGLTSAFGCRGGKPVPKTALSSIEQRRIPGLRDFGAAMKRVAKSHPMVLLTSAYALIQVGLISVDSGLFPCIIIYHVSGGSQARASVLLGAAATSWLVTALLLSPPVFWLSQRIGKKQALLAFLSLSLAGSSLRWLFYSPTHPYLIVIPFALYGCGTGAFFSLAPSMTADACDLEESESGARDSGMFSAFFYWMNKLGVSIGVVLTGLFLNLTGFSVSQGTALSKATVINMKLVDSAVPSVAIAIGMVMILRYPLTAKRMESVRMALERRKAPPDEWLETPNILEKNYVQR